MAASPKRSIMSWIWDNDSDEKSEAEKKFLRKLDFFILFSSCLGFFLKYVDQTNIGNAYISGMKEDLGIMANEYTIMGTCYTISYAIGQIPGNIMVLKIRPSIWLAMLEIGWGAFTFAQAGAKTSGQMMAFRFMIGLFESSFFTVILYVLSSWYNKAELGKRMSIFYLCASVGSATSGWMQAAIYKSMNGIHGMPGWRWLYILCGVMTVPGALSILFFIPDTPETTKAFYLTEDDIAIAKDRMVRAKVAQSTGKIDFATFKRILGRWHFWLFVLCYTCYGNSAGAAGQFGVWMKSAGFSVSDRNIIPTGVNLITIGTIFFYGLFSDMTGSRFSFVVGPLLYGLIPNAILTAWPSGNRIKEFAFMTSNVQLMTPILFTWAAEVCKKDAAERSIVMASMNGIQYAFAAWTPLLIWKQTDSPKFHLGFPTSVGLGVAAIIFACIIFYLDNRDKKAEEALGPAADEESVVEEKMDFKDVTTIAVSPTLAGNQ